MSYHRCYKKWKCAFGVGDILSPLGLSSAPAALKVTPEGCILKMISCSWIAKQKNQKSLSFQGC